MRDCSRECALRRDSEAAMDPSRRRFVTRALVASVGAFLASCGDGNIGGVTGTDGTGASPAPTPGGGTGLTIRLADFPALVSNGGIARVDGGSATPVAVTRVNASTYLAFSMICPHAGYKPIGIQGGGFECPNHGARFAADGNWIGGQRTRDLNQYSVVYDAGPGTLTIT